jgi:sugar lactone lactonase YvrE
MKIGKDSLLYVLQWTGSNPPVRRYQLDGTFVDDFTSVGVPQSIGIDWDSSGNLYVSSYNGKNVRKFDQNGNDLGLFVNSNLLGPTNIWFDDNGDLLVSDYNGTAVKRFDSDGNYLDDFITGIHFSEGVDFFPNGNILIGNGATHSVKMFDSNGNYIEDFIPSGSGGLVTPNAIVIRETGTLSVDDNENISLKNFQLEQNYPNPFNPTTNIRFQIADRGFATLKVFNVLGNEIETLVNKELEEGEYKFTFDASGIPSGIYFYQLKVGSFIQTNKMVYLK